MRITRNALLSVCLLTAMPALNAADKVSRDKIKGLDEQVQDIKTDVLAISTELLQLEETLIYPSNTQVSVFVSVAPDHDVRLDSLDVIVDGEEVTHHVYTHKELEALKSGGVQRVYTGNVRSGKHTLEVVLSGVTAGNDEYRETATHTFTKEEGPSLVEVSLFGSNNNIHFKDR
ncbi:MAG: hypothetical protein VX793_02500 [Pseudomonadota bacterium]|nr:hypothetical protein [Pseudomonadota bacterium]